MAFITKMLFAFLFVSFVVFVASKPADMATEKEQQEALTLKESINQFSAQFYKETAAENPGKNLIMSPLSAEIVLAMLSLGATDETLADLNKALYLPDANFTRSAFKPAIKRLNSVQGVTLNVANKVFVKDGPKYLLHKDFKANAVDIFQSEAENINFANSVAAAHTINTWVEDKTNKKIKDLIKSDSLTEDTRLVLVNAIYFKGLWQNKFNAGETKKMDFHLNNKEKTQVDMMHKTTDFFYADIPEWDAKILELPYEKNEMSMVIVLPNQIEGLAALEEKLAAGASLNEMLQRMRKVEVTVDLPKFKIETTIDLNKVLPKLGMARIFDEVNAQLKGLLENDEQLYVSEAIQKAFIEVNEQGAEAAAATAIMMRRNYAKWIRDDDHVIMLFEVNKPFMFVMVNKELLPVFLGCARTIKTD